MNRPPQGIMPKYIWDERRRDEIKEAIVRFIEVNRTIPVKWIEEYNELIDGTRMDGIESFVKRLENLIKK